jgi:hypothetical protein
MNHSRFPLRRLAAIAAVITALALCGCYNPFSPRIAPELGFSVPAPAPTSPPNLLRLFEWCYNNKAIAEYREIFTDDLRFVFSPLDSAGADYRGTPWTREDELISTTNLFVGGSADQPPASSIRLSLDKNFFVYPDPDFARTDPQGRAHTNIRTQVVLQIQTGDGSSIDISGAANFYMVRGDSAVIPAELTARGFGPDPNRWYIRKWVDQDAGGGLAARRVDGAWLAARRSPGVSAAATSPAAGRRMTVTAAAQDFPMVASWGYAKEYYRRMSGVTPYRASAAPPPR